jgi:hypothetical protein
LKAARLLSFKSTDFWVKGYSEGDFSGMDFNGRKYQCSDLFYDMYPDIESDAKNWSIVQTSDKSSKFSPLDLVIYITDIFKTTYEVDVGDDYVRSVSSCK